MGREPAPGLYRHHKGGRYVVLGVAQHSESKDWLVVYHPLGDPDDLWVRPVDMWDEELVIGDSSKPRFQRLHTDEGQDVQRGPRNA